jgi:hypothetical protein
MPDNKIVDIEKINKFFRKEPIKYESRLGHTQAGLIIQQEDIYPLTDGIDYLCSANLKVEYLRAYKESPKNPFFNWRPACLHVNSKNFVYLDGLFKRMNNYAENLSEMLSAEGWKLSSHELKSAFNILEGQFKTDFDTDEFRKYLRELKK